MGSPRSFLLTSDLWLQEQPLHPCQPGAWVISCFIWQLLAGQVPGSHVADGLPYPQQIWTKLGVHFFEIIYAYEHKMRIKTIFIIGLQSWQLGSTADLAILGSIGRPIQLLSLMANDEDCFYAHLWVKTFKKVHSQLCSNLLGLGQCICHMWDNLFSRISGPFLKLKT